MLFGLHYDKAISEKSKSVERICSPKAPLLGSTQPPATQVTHARRESAQFRSFTNFFLVSDARGRLPGRPPNSESRHIQPDNAARRARRCIRTMPRSPPVKPVPATVHGEGVRLQYYLISALRGVNPLKDLLSAKRLCHRIARQDGFAVFRH